MEGHPPTLDDFPTLRRVFRTCLFPVGMEVYPFHIGWYNELVEPPYQLDYDPNTVAFVVTSGPDTFERATLRYLKSRFAKDPDYQTLDPIDESMDYVLDYTEEELRNELMDPVILRDFDMDESTPSPRPRILVQTAAHCAGAVEYFQISQTPKDELLDDGWIADAKLQGVAIHPEYGGWFAIRGVIILQDLVLDDSAKWIKPERPIVVNDTSVIWNLLKEFITNWQEDTWRDIIPHSDSRKYSLVFRTLLSLERGAERWDFLKSNDILISGPNDYDEGGGGDTEYNDD